MPPKLKVLLIEDDQQTIDLYKMRFDLANFETIALTHGEEAIFWAKETKILPDIIIVDLMLPGSNGFEVIKAYQNLSKFKKIPLMILTAFADSERERRAKEMGIKYYFLKTMITPQELVEKIQQIVKESKV